MQKNEIGPLSHTIYKTFNSKWIKNLNIRPELKLLEKKIGQELHNTKFGNDFLDMTPKEQIIKKIRLNEDF